LPSMVTSLDLANLTVLVRVSEQATPNCTVPFFLTALSKAFCVHVVMVVVPPPAQAGAEAAPFRAGSRKPRRSRPPRAHSDPFAPRAPAHQPIGTPSTVARPASGVHRRDADVGRRLSALGPAVGWVGRRNGRPPLARGYRPVVRL
jgi:hypothetical protein